MPRWSVLLLILCCSTLVCCGYLDTEMEMEDEEWEESFGIGGIGISGSGTGYGCGGGMGFFGRRRPHLAGSSGGTARLPDPFGYGFGEFHIRGRVPADEPATDVAVVAESPRPVDWVGHFDEVSTERQNELLAAWIEGQLADSAQ